MTDGNSDKDKIFVVIRRPVSQLSLEINFSSSENCSFNAARIFERVLAFGGAQGPCHLGGSQEQTVQFYHFSAIQLRDCPLRRRAFTL